MDAATMTAILALATTLVGAVAYALKKRADAEKMRARRDVLEAEADKQRAEDTGRLLVGAEADAAQVRRWIDDLRGRLDRCEKRHEDCEVRATERETAHASVLVAKQAQIDALWRETRELRTSIESGGVR